VVISLSALEAGELPTQTLLVQGIVRCRAVILGLNRVAEPVTSLLEMQMPWLTPLLG